jgi:glycosyltransferase involved in cell wall biosynthesis
VTKLLIATDAWGPQINGVVRSLENIAAHAASFDMEVRFLTPSDFWTLPLPGYGEIRLALTNHRKIAASIAEFAPDFVHIATEGPIGLAARRACLRERRPFTTSYHTRFPEYLAARMPVPIRLTYAALRRFHNAAAGTMVSSPSLESLLAGRGFRNLMRWSRGVDETLFRPRAESVLDALPRPIFLFVGRLAVEKNVDAFLRLDLPGSKVVVGNGPLQARLAAAHPEVHFLGTRCGEDLAKVYSSADVFVFPSLTDTFGIVLLEALSSGVPVAAFPVTGPVDVIGDSGTGVLAHDLRDAALRALRIPREGCRTHAMQFTWKESARQFFENIRIAQLRRDGSARSKLAGLAEPA